jgi:hypothetical protein
MITIILILLSHIHLCHETVTGHWARHGRLTMITIILILLSHIHLCHFTLQVSKIKFCTYFSSPPHMLLAQPISSSWFGNPKNIWRVKIMKSLPPSCHFPRLSKYSPQHPVLKHPQSMAVPRSTDQIPHTTKQQVLYVLIFFYTEDRKASQLW